MSRKLLNLVVLIALVFGLCASAVPARAQQAPAQSTTIPTISNFRVTPNVANVNGGVSVDATISGADSAATYTLLYGQNNRQGDGDARPEVYHQGISAVCSGNGAMLVLNLTVRNPDGREASAVTTMNVNGCTGGSTATPTATPTATATRQVPPTLPPTQAPTASPTATKWEPTASPTPEPPTSTPTQQPAQPTATAQPLPPTATPTSIPLPVGNVGFNPSEIMEGENSTLVWGVTGAREVEVDLIPSTHTGTREYTNLSPGIVTVLLTARNDGGAMTPINATLKVNALPPCPQVIVVPAPTPVGVDKLHLPAVISEGQKCKNIFPPITATPLPTAVPVEITLGLFQPSVARSPSGDCLEPLEPRATPGRAASAPQTCLIDGTYPSFKISYGQNSSMAIGNVYNGAPSALGGRAGLNITGVRIVQGNFSLTISGKPTLQEGPVGASGTVTYTAFPLDNLHMVSAAGVTVNPVWAQEFIQRLLLNVAKGGDNERRAHVKMPLDQTMVDVTGNNPTTLRREILGVLPISSQGHPWTPTYITKAADNHALLCGIWGPDVGGGGSQIAFRMGTRVCTRFANLVLSENPELVRWRNAAWDVSGLASATTWFQMPDLQIPAPSGEQQVYFFSAVGLGGAGVALLTVVEKVGQVFNPIGMYLMVRSEDLDCIVYNVCETSFE